MKQNQFEKIYRRREAELADVKLDITVYTNLVIIFTILTSCFLIATLIWPEFLLMMLIFFVPLVILVFILLSKEFQADHLDNLLEQTYERVSDYINL